MSAIAPLRHPVAILAGLLAWAAVGLELWTGPVQATDAAAGLPVAALARGLHLGFGLLYAVSLRWRARGARLACAAALCALALTLVALYRYNSAAALLILPMLEFAALLPLPALTAAYALNNAALLAIVLLWRGMDAPYTHVALHASLQLFAILLVRAHRRSEAARAALARTHAELLAARGLLAETARSEERLRLSRELHDVAGHKLAALKLNLAALQYNRDLDAPAAIALCARLTDELLDDLRALARQLRLHDGLDLGATLQRVAAAFPRPQVHLRIEPDARAADLEQAEALLRAFQEGLTNAARHGEARNLWASLRRDGERLLLELRDDGRGHGELRAGHGLTGMRERLRALGGDLDVGRDADGGVRLLGWLPAR
ncbi:sensor histidine kinase [Lysobacter sp. K5869]|uniref:sensor histidine kinase n=1 Tax=Lysobacter sp. K5869 TaxID=2820808 RepID=UPI001C061DC3|nr:histidine kinase [Lysobacter sp. K5869]QWP74931.1 sensor histidine kinase [Lysobacter sp. K5869]